MKAPRIISFLVALSFICLTSAPVIAEPFPPGPENDSRSSLGIFRIHIVPEFRLMIEDLALPVCGPDLDAQLLYPNGCYTYDDPTHPHRLTSPVLADRHGQSGRPAIVARSAPHIDGSAEDLGGTLVGLDAYETTVGDGDILLRPAFEGPDGRTEVHVAVAMMDLTGGTDLSISVQAGHSFGLPLSPGEVESKTGSELPGESFFNVYVEVRFPTPYGEAVLINHNPLLIVNEDVESLPPTVVYTHENSYAVDVWFANSNSPHWNAGDHFGQMVLAGHGFDFGGSKGVPEFLAIMNNHLATKGEMPIRPGGDIPTLSEWGLIIFCLLLFGWMAWLVVRRRRAAEAGI